MGTPGAIGVYLESGDPPVHVKERPWRGVYVSLDGFPSSLGDALLDRIEAADGDLDAVVREVIDGAPHGWRVLGKDEQMNTDDSGDEVGHDQNLGNVCYCYLIDPVARRVDLFETHARAEGLRKLSLRVNPDGTTVPDGFAGPRPPKREPAGPRPPKREPAGPWWKRLFG